MSTHPRSSSPLPFTTTPANTGRPGRTPTVLRIDRRREVRSEAAARLPATYSDGERHGITHLEVVDQSASGLGALTRSPIEPGMVVTICPEGSAVPWVTGRAVRCAREGEMWRVGLVFDRRAAA